MNFKQRRGRTTLASSMFRPSLSLSAAYLCLFADYNREQSCGGEQLGPLTPLPPSLPPPEDFTFHLLHAPQAAERGLLPMRAEDAAFLPSSPSKHLIGFANIAPSSFKGGQGGLYSVAHPLVCDIFLCELRGPA